MNKFTPLFLVAILSSLIISTKLSAHNVHREKKNIIVVDDVVKFRLHEVRKKESLFSISRSYDVPTSLVTKFNKQVTGGNISPDDILFIPVIDKKQVDSSLSRFEKLEYALHYVRSKETLSLISRLYSIPQEVIVHNNPSIDFEILQVDDIIVLPLQFSTTATAPSASPATSPASKPKSPAKPLRQHHIAQGETLYFVSKMYNVSIDSIKKYNPELSVSSISIGTIINIPPIIESSMVAAAPVSIFKECRTFPKDSILNIMVVMPFERKNEKELERTYRYLAFYDGIKLAAQELVKQGHKINLSLTSSEIVDNLERSIPTLVKQHFVIGLLYEKEIHKLLPLLQQHNIPFISAISVSNNLLTHYFNYYQVMAANERLLYNNVKRVMQNNPKNKVTIITKSGSREDKLMEKQLLYELNITDTLRVIHRDNISDESLEQAVNAFRVGESSGTSVTLLSCNMQNTAKSANYALLQALSAKKNNTIIVLSDQEPFVTQILSTLKIFKNQYKPEVKVVGSAQWLRFTSLDIELLYNNKIEVATNQYIDYDSPAIQQILQRYQNEYSIEPTPLAFKGYDIMRYFCWAYQLYGKALGHCINPTFRQPLLTSSFDMKQACPTCGFENRGSIYLEYTEDIDIIMSK